MEKVLFKDDSATLEELFTRIDEKKVNKAIQDK
jgi:hypothetical protein